MTSLSRGSTDKSAIGRQMLAIAGLEDPDALAEFTAAAARKEQAETIRDFHRIVSEAATEDRQEALADYWLAHARCAGATARWKAAAKRLSEAAIRAAKRDAQQAADTWRAAR